MLTRRHHYVPRFYLSAWTGADGRLVEYSRRSGGLHEWRRWPRQTAYGWDLNTVIKDVVGPPEDTDELETKYFGSIDNAAAPVHRKIIDSDPLLPVALTPEERMAWARFMSSLLARGARVLADNDAKARAIGVERREAWRKLFPTDRERDVIDRLNLDSLARRIVREHMVRQIDNPAHLERLVRRSWHLARAPEGVEFVTSDEPIVLNLGQATPTLNLVSMAMSPRLLLVFLPSPKSEEEESQWEELVAPIAIGHGLTLATGPSQFIYSASPITDGVAWGPVTVNLRKVLEEQFIARTLTVGDDAESAEEWQDAGETDRNAEQAPQADGEPQRE